MLDIYFCIQNIRNLTQPYMLEKQNISGLLASSIHAPLCQSPKCLSKAIGSFLNFVIQMKKVSFLLSSLYCRLLFREPILIKTNIGFHVAGMALGALQIEKSYYLKSAHQNACKYSIRRLNTIFTVI